jgi:ubiquinone/menaquinone biosynthesis C-methylase UbiE
LTPEQLRIRDEFMGLWHETLPAKYAVIERFNHGYPVRMRRRKKERIRSLEIGAGLGAHLAFEDLSTQEYYALELRPEMAARIAERFPSCTVTTGDCQARLSFEHDYFDRVLAIHVLEHLPDLPAALREIHRVLKPDGQLCVVIPCEGGLAYTLARNISARRLFEKRFNQPYDWLIDSEHINRPDEIVDELARLFTIEGKRYFPLSIPVISLNLCIGLTLTPAPLAAA